MQGLLKFVYYGLESFQGKKDPSKTYYNLALLQGMEPIKIFLETGQEELINSLNLSKYDEIQCNVSWSLGTDKYGAKINYRLLTIPELILNVPFEDNASSPTPDVQKEDKVKHKTSA